MYPVVGPAKVAALALQGGSTSTTPPREDGPQADAIWAVAEQMTDGLTSTRKFQITSAGNAVVGLVNIQGQDPLTSIWYKNTLRWDGLKRRTGGAISTKATTPAILAARALIGGTSSKPFEDGPEAAAIFAIALAITEGLSSTLKYQVTPIGNVIVGLVNIQGQRPLTSIWYKSSSRWDGLRRR